MKRVLLTLLGAAAFFAAGLFLAATNAQALNAQQLGDEIRSSIRAPNVPVLSSQAVEPAVETQAAADSASPAAAGEKVIEVSISEQRLRAWEGERLVMETPVSTGAPGKETPTGEYRIQSKTPNHWSTIYHVDMPWAMRVVGGIFIHELPIAPDGRRIGEADLGRAVSGGCIRVGMGVARELYEWADVGTRVVIH